MCKAMQSRFTYLSLELKLCALHVYWLLHVMVDIAMHLGGAADLLDTAQAATMPCYVNCR